VLTVIRAIDRYWQLLAATGSDATGRYWTLLDATGRYWTLLDATGRYWTLLDASGR